MSETDINVPDKKASKKVEAIKKRGDVERIRQYFVANYRHGDMYAFLWTCGCNMGLRAGDLRLLTCGELRREWFDFREQKTGKMRRLYVNKKVRKAFEKYISKYLFIADESQLFSCQKGYPVEIKHIHKMIKRATRKLGIDGNYGSHTMRKTFAYHAFRRNPTRQNLELIRTAFGHSSTYTTRIYTGFTNDEIDGDGDAVGEIKDIYMGLDL